MNRWKLALAVAGLTLSMGTLVPVMGQAGGGGGGGGGGGNRMTPEERQAAQAKRTQEQLGATDDEFKVIQPKIQKVNEARQASMAGMFGGFGGGGGGRGGRGGAAAGGDAAASRPSSPVADARQELNTVLANKDSTPEQIKSKLEAFRKARDTNRDALKKAQDDLKAVLTARQEAILVANGTLE